MAPMVFYTLQNSLSYSLWTQSTSP